jgi:hypothetical protein
MAVCQGGQLAVLVLSVKPARSVTLPRVGILLRFAWATPPPSDTELRMLPVGEGGSFSGTPPAVAHGLAPGPAADEPAALVVPVPWLLLGAGASSPNTSTGSPPRCNAGKRGIKRVESVSVDMLFGIAQLRHHTAHTSEWPRCNSGSSTNRVALASVVMLLHVRAFNSTQQTLHCRLCWTSHPSAVTVPFGREKCQALVQTAKLVGNLLIAQVLSNRPLSGRDSGC